MLNKEKFGYFVNLLKIKILWGIENKDSLHKVET